MRTNERAMQVKTTLDEDSLNFTINQGNSTFWNTLHFTLDDVTRADHVAVSSP